MLSRTVVVSLVAAGLLITSGLSPASAQGRNLKDRFVGTWKLVSIETRNAKGEVVPPAAGAGNQNRTGYIVYDDAGYMAVTIMPLGRKKNAGAQQTDEEALAALAGYTGYFGTFTINEKEQFVTHHLEGSVNPGMERDQKRFFELSGNRLTLKPPPGASGNQQRLTWERMPDVATLTAEHKKFVGFWKLISNERRNDKGEVLGTNPGQTGYIIYTAAGFMTVHMVQPDRKPYAAAQATPQEARQNTRTYTNYFGPFYIHEVDGYVVHDQVGSLGVGRGGYSPQQRFYRFVGNRLLLQPPPTYNADGTVTQGTITWEKVGRAAGTERPRERIIMKIQALGLAAVMVASVASIASAQLVAAKDGPIVYGHHHFNVTSVDEHRKFWTTIGGTAIKIGVDNDREIIRFPNVLVFMTARPPKGGTKGTSVNHVGFTVPNLRQAVDKVKAAGYPIITRAELPESQPVKDDLAYIENQKTSVAFVMGPDETKVELVENKAATSPAAMHHIHFATQQVDDMKAWYVKVFGAKPGMRGSFQAADLPGVNLTYSPSPDAVVGTQGRSLDHIGFEVRNLEAFCKTLEAMGIKLERPYTPVPALGIGIAFIRDPWGTYIELTEGLDKVK